MIWKKVLRENWWKLFALFILIEANLIISIRFYPDFSKNFALLSQISIAKIPIVEKLLQMVGLAGYTGYFLLQHFFKALNVLGSVGAVLLGMSVVAKEVENRTIEVLLSRPVSRGKILFANFATGIVLIHVLVLLSSWSAIPLSGIIEIEEELSPEIVLLCGLHSALFLSLLYAASIWVSCMLSDQAKVIFISAGFFVAMFLFYFVQTMNKLSIYRWNDLNQLLEIQRSGHIPYTLDLCLLGGIITFFFLSLKTFKSRDF